jgi:two-component system response regulator YesN
MKVLVVDDEKLVRRGLISMMPWEQYGMEVIAEAMNGKKALECMEREPADLVFTDLMMPVMSGFELMEVLKSQYPHTSVVVLSCHEEFALAQQAIRMGAIDYVVKNDLETERMDEVLERISANCRHKSALASKREREKIAFYEPSSGPWNEMPVAGGDAPLPGQERSAELRAAESLWQEMKWLYDDRAYEHLLDQTRKFRLPLPELKSIVFSALLKAGYLMLAVDYSVRWISLLEQGRHWDEWRNIIDEGRGYFRGILFREKLAPDIVNGIFQAIRYMHDKEELDFSQNEVAQAANMSRTYFSKSFKEVTGKSFQEYVKEFRLYKARQLLRNSDQPIYSIARQIGFRDEKYFSKTFQKQFGMLPSAYRNQKPAL